MMAIDRNWYVCMRSNDVSDNRNDKTVFVFLELEKKNVQWNIATINLCPSTRSKLIDTRTTTGFLLLVIEILYSVTKLLKSPDGIKCQVGMFLIAQSRYHYFPECLCPWREAKTDGLSNVLWITIFFKRGCPGWWRELKLNWIRIQLTKKKKLWLKRRWAFWRFC